MTVRAAHVSAGLGLQSRPTVGSTMRPVHESLWISSGVESSNRSSLLAWNL
jgi:hypothetical protein